MKKVIALLLVAAIGLSVTGCSTNQTDSQGNVSSESSKEAVADPSVSQNDENSENSKSMEKEAPELAKQVAEGKLPPLEERLPVAEDVMVEPNIEEVGQYGGSFTTTALDNGRWTWGTFTEQSMFRFKQDGSGTVEANVCKEFSANEDSTVWTIKLREGMKWSDGQPFTADDIIFYYNHMSVPALNEDRTAVAVDVEGYYNAYTSKPYNCYQVLKDGKKYWAEFAKVNDYEFTVTFAASKPGFPEEVAVDNKWMFLPKHFYVNYVARKDGVADDASFPLLTEEQALANANKDFGKQWDSYSTLGKEIGYWNMDYAAIPQLRSFIAVKDNWNTVGETYELVRNPYFWKTDSEGRQLPYLDSIKVKIINEDAQVALQGMAGEFDSYEIRNDFAAVATAIQETHDIRQWVLPNWSTAETIQLNQTVKDMDKRNLFQDKRFRQALSICVDRNLLNNSIRNGMSKPAQASVPEGVQGYDEQWTKKWTEYDVAAANTLMDEITEPWDGKDGTYRKMKGTNKEAEIVLSVREPSESADFVTILEAAYRAIGVKLSIKVDADYRTTMLSNDVEASLEVTGLSTPALRPDSIIPMRNVAVWHSAYGKWYEDGKSTQNGGIEPTGDMLELINCYEAIQSATGSDREKVIADNVQKIYELHEENVWIIGYLAPLPLRLPVSKTLKNFPDKLVWVDEFRLWNMSRPEQFWRSE